MYGVAVEASRIDDSSVDTSSSFSTWHGSEMGCRFDDDRCTTGRAGWTASGLHLIFYGE